MKVHFDPGSDAIYLRLDDSTIVESEEVHPGVVLDFNADNNVVAIEVLHVRSRFPDADLTNLEFEVA